MSNLNYPPKSTGIPPGGNIGQIVANNGPGEGIWEDLPNGSTINTLASSASGNVYWSMTENGIGKKEVIAVFDNYGDPNGGIIVFPTPFVYTPSYFKGNGITITPISISVNNLIIGASVTQTGVLIVKGF